MWSLCDFVDANAATVTTVTTTVVVEKGRRWGKLLAKLSGTAAARTRDRLLTRRVSFDGGKCENVPHFPRSVHRTFCRVWRADADRKATNCGDVASVV